MKHPAQRDWWTKTRTSWTLLLVVIVVLSPDAEVGLLSRVIGAVVIAIATIAIGVSALKVVQGVVGRIRTMDNRAQSLGIVRFFATLVVGAALAYFLTLVTNPILDRAATEGQGTAAAQATPWFSAAVEYYVVGILFISFFGLIVLSLYQRRVAS